MTGAHVALTAPAAPTGLRRVAFAIMRRLRTVQAELLDYRSPRLVSSATGASTSILFVCHGNICRSAMAEGVLRTKLAAAGLSAHVRVDSAGTHALAGARPDPRARLCLLRRGISIKDLRARRFCEADLESFDRILVMDTKNLRDVVELADENGDRGRVRLLLEGSDAPEISDPIWGGQTQFERTYAEVDSACDALVEELKSGLLHSQTASTSSLER